jgi:DNA-binding transcriptional LysR family regulator
MRINFELNDLRAFLAVLDLEGFHRAAEHLGMSQPALSRRIQALEQMVGAPLLERTTRRVAPTTWEPHLLRWRAVCSMILKAACCR